MIEATCNTCGETFVPASLSEDDFEHFQTDAGDDCGGRAVMPVTVYS